MSDNGYKLRLKVENPSRYKAYNMAGGLRMGRGGVERLHRLLELNLNTQCKYCGILLSVKNASLDHRKPLIKSTVKNMSPQELLVINSDDNLQIICLSCNRTKGNLSHDQFLKLLTFLETDENMKKIVLARLKASNFIYGK